MAEDAGAPSEMTPQPVANPDAQTTVNDFLDYTEFFPSDLVRSLRLIGDLDQTYQDATHKVHQLTVKYGKLPTLPAAERPDPTTLRREIALALDKAIYCRESSYAEASRLYEVAERHKHRIGIIKRKLQAQPEPPSRDPTPAPVSPQAPASLNRNFSTPHLRLTLDGRYGGSSTARPRNRNRSRVDPPGARGRSASFSDASDDSDVPSTNGLAVAAPKLRQPKDRAPRVPKARVRAPGSGTNVHSSFAGISTSNALARLSPPPENARPGSKWAPWFKLTEYEMAVLRKKMKKNAVWTPSETMIKRQLEAGGRGQEAYDKEKQRCEETGDEFLDEEPAVPTLRSVIPPAVVDAAPVPAPTVPAPTTTTSTTAAAAPTATDTVPAPIETSKDPEHDETNTSNDTPEARDTRKSKRDSHRRQAERDVEELEKATRRIKAAADGLQELIFSTPNTDKKSTTRSSNKRKRDSTPQPTAETPSVATREPSAASQDSSTKPPEPKKLRLTLPAQPAETSTPQNLTPIAPSPATKSPVPLPETTKTTTVQIPLAPAGPGTPKSAVIQPVAAASQPSTPAAPSPAIASPAEALKSPAVPPPAPSQSNVTAASTRPRRESVAPKAASPPPPAPVQPVKKQKASTPAPEPAPPAPVQPLRPRSARGHVPTPKAQSEEPKPPELEKVPREVSRRHSIFSQSALNAPTRTSTRKKPPPKGEITTSEGGQKTVTNAKRVQGHKNKKKKKSGEESELEDIDPNEEQYCICEDVSYGTMVKCDNQCEREWFHYNCVGLEENVQFGRRIKWYCPECRETLGTDAHGNPKVPPPLPGRRGNRGWST